MAQTSGFIQVDFDGTGVRVADINKTNIVEDSVAETRLAALLGSKGIDIPFLLSDKGVVIRDADKEHAATIRDTIASHPALALQEVGHVSNVPDMNGAFAKAAGAGYVQPVTAFAPRVDAVTTITGRIAPPRAANLTSAPVAMAA